MNKFFYFSESSEILMTETTKALRDGCLVCVPTETVYGIICDAHQPKAIQALVEAKGREKEKPFALFTDGLKRVEQAGAILSEKAYQLTEAFWPGPLTLVLPAKSDCPCEHKGSVGVRAPDVDFLQSLIVEFDGLLVNTSLNKSGEPPVWELEVDSEIMQHMDLVIDAGKLDKTPPSTVVDCRDGRFRILREGALSSEDIKRRFQAK